MGWEIIYDEKNDKYSIWSTVVGDWIKENLTKDELLDYLIKSEEDFYNRYSRQGYCVICYPFKEEGGKIICAGTSLLDKYKNCSEFAKREYGGIAVSKQTYLMYSKQNWEDRIEEAYGESKGKEEWKKSLIRIPFEAIKKFGEEEEL